MVLLLINDLRRQFGAQEVLRGIDLQIAEGDKIGVVGRNGGGKTTLLRLIEGEETPDAGKVQLTRGTRMGYVAQRPKFAAGVTVREYVEGGLSEVHRTREELEEVGHELAGAEGEELERAMKRYDHLNQRMEFLDGWNAESRVEAVMHGIGLEDEFWEREARTLSGGEKSRTALARELVSTPDLLLLDEPTNHLDLPGIEWIEAYLRDLKGAVLVVSHDRRLLDRAVDSIAEVERGLLTRYPGNYTKYIQLKEERFRVGHQQWALQQEQIRKEESFIRKHMGSQRTAEAKGRQKKLSHVVRLEQPYHDVRRPVIKLKEVERGGERVLVAEHLTVGYPGAPILEDIEVRIGRGERIGIVGANGAGKSTLLKVLAGRTQPLAGELKLGHKATCGYYDQDVTDLREDGTPYTEIRRDHPQLTDLEIRNHLARFLFRGNDIDAEVKSLSGGERARLSLARLVLTTPSWLALDEPTNHLDLAARTALEEMLGAFSGALVCVSHDREFLDGLCTRILEIRDGGVFSYPGNYSAWRAALQEEAEGRAAVADKRREAEKQQRRKQAEAEAAKQQKAKSQDKQKSKQSSGRDATPRNPYLFKKLEESIMSLEEQREQLQAELGTESVWKDPDALRERQFRLAELERDLQQKNKEWERWA